MHTNAWHTVHCKSSFIADKKCHQKSGKPHFLFPGERNMPIQQSAAIERREVIPLQRIKGTGLCYTLNPVFSRSPNTWPLGLHCLKQRMGAFPINSTKRWLSSTFPSQTGSLGHTRLGFLCPGVRPFWF